MAALKNKYLYNLFIAILLLGLSHAQGQSVKVVYDSVLQKQRMAKQIADSLIGIRASISSGVAGVSSVNGNTGAITIDTGYIANFSTKVRNAISPGTNITIVNGQISSTSSGGSSFPTQQSHTTGTSVTITNQSTDIWLLVNPSSTLATLTITFPATLVDGQKIEISFGGTLTTGNVVTAITLNGNTGHTLLNAPTGSVDAGETINLQVQIFKYNFI